MWAGDGCRKNDHHDLCAYSTIKPSSYKRTLIQLGMPKFDCVYSKTSQASCRRRPCTDASWFAWWCSPHCIRDITPNKHVRQHIALTARAIKPSALELRARNSFSIIARVRPNLSIVSISLIHVPYCTVRTSALLQLVTKSP